MTPEPTRESDRVLDLLLEEQHGIQLPDLTDRVRQAASPSPPATPARNHRWLSAAAVFLGLAAVIAVAYQATRDGDGTSERTLPQTPPPRTPVAPPQDPGPKLQPKTLAQWRDLLDGVQSIQIQPVLTKRHSARLEDAIPTGFRTEDVVRSVCNELKRCGPMAARAGFIWPNRIRLIRADGYLEISLFQQIVGMSGLADLNASERLLASLGPLVDRAETAERRRTGVVFDGAELTADHPDAVSRDIDVLRGYGLTDTDLELLAEFEKLRVVNLQYSRKTLGNDGMVELARAVSIEELRLPYTLITDSGLEALGKLPRLRRLVLRYGGDGRKADSVPMLRNIPTIGKLFRTQNRLTGEGLRGFAGHPFLEELDLSWHTELTDVGLQQLPAIPNLRVLDLSGRRLGMPAERKRGAVTVAGLRDALGGCRALQELDLGDSRLDLDEILVGLGRLTNLRALDVADTGVTAGGLAHLQAESLRTLNLSRCKGLDSTAMAQIARLTKLRDLRILRATKCTDVDLSQLGRLRDLRSLELSQTPIGRLTAEALANCPELNSLDLSFCKVDDAALEALSTAPALIRLDLAGNDGITDAGLLHLGRVKTLEQVNLNVADGFTAEGVAALRRALPDVDIRLPSRLR